MDLVLSTTELWQLLELQVSNRGRTEETVFGSIAMDVDRSYSNNAEESLSTSSCTTVLEFLRSIPMDSISGRDSIEAMFRSFSASGEELVMAVDSNAGSGGYAEYIFKYAASSLYGLDLWNIPLDYKEGRNPDMTEVDINLLDIAGSNEGSRALKFARAYGFRNIQSIMLKLRRGTCDYDYVEIMACPSGCNNGGGQLKAIGKETPSETKERVQEVEKEYHTTSARKPDDSPLVKYIYNLGTLEYIGADSLIGKSLGLHPLSDEVRSLFHTRYHAVPKLEVVAPLAAKW